MTCRLGNLAGRLRTGLHRPVGQAMVEYGIILALVSVVVIIVLITQGTQLQHLFSNVTCSFSQSGCQVSRPLPD